MQRRLVGLGDERSAKAAAAAPEGRAIRHSPSDLRRIRIILVAFFALVVLSAFLHEPWRDEWQAWLIARDSSSLLDVLHNSRYEGHPPLWYFALWLLSRVSRDILAMQLFNAVIATATAAVVLWRAPFPLLARAALIFGYLPFYEYGTVARSYGLGLLLMVLVCTEIARASRRPLPIAALLSLMILTSVHTMIVALALLAALLVDDVFVRRTRNVGVRPSRQALLGAAIIGLSLVWSVAQILPPADGNFGVGLDTPAGARSGLATFDLVTATVLTSDRVLPPQPISFAVGVAIIALLAWRVRWRPAAFTLVVAGTGVLLGLAAFRFTGGVRHFGHLYLIAVAALWLEHSFTAFIDKPRKRGYGDRVFSLFIVLVLSAQVASGARSAVRDWFLANTSTPAAATWLEQNDLDDAPLLGAPDNRVSSVAGAIDRPILFLNHDRVGTFLLRQNTRREVTTEDIVAAARSTLESSDQVVVLVPDRLTGDLGPLKLAAFFTDQIKYEWIYVYVGGEPSTTGDEDQ